MDGLVGHLHMQGIPVGIGIDSDGLNAHLARGLDNAARNLTAVCDQDFVKHLQVPLKRNVVMLAPRVVELLVAQHGK